MLIIRLIGILRLLDLIQTPTSLKIIYHIRLLYYSNVAFYFYLDSKDELLYTYQSPFCKFIYHILIYLTFLLQDSILVLLDFCVVVMTMILVVMTLTIIYNNYCYRVTI